MKTMLKGEPFYFIPDIEKATAEKLKALLKNAFQKCFESWYACWNKYTANLGEYFQRD